MNSSSSVGLSEPTTTTFAVLSALSSILTVISPFVAVTVVLPFAVIGIPIVAFMVPALKLIAVASVTVGLVDRASTVKVFVSPAVVTLKVALLLAVILTPKALAPNVAFVLSIAMLASCESLSSCVKV